MFSAWIKKKMEANNINDLIDYMLTSNKYKKIELCTNLKISRSTLDKWLESKEYDTLMSVKHMIALFEFFGYDTEIIFDNNRKETMNQINKYYDNIIKGKEKGYSMLLNENDRLSHEIGLLRTQLNDGSIDTNKAIISLQCELDNEIQENKELKEYVNRLTAAYKDANFKLYKYRDVMNMLKDMFNDDIHNDNDSDNNDNNNDDSINNYDSNISL